MPTSYDDFCDACTREFESKNRAWADRYGIGTFPRWDYDDTDKLLVFSDDAAPSVLCTYVNIGSLSNKTGTWLWAWANNSLPEPSKEGSQKALLYGQKHNITELTDPHFKAEPEDAWTFAAITGHLIGAQALYRPVVDHLEIYMAVMSTRPIES